MNKKASTHNVEEFGEIVSKALDSYKSDFMELVREYAISCKNQGEAYCDFFVDIASMMNGAWFLTAVCEFEYVYEFKAFNWSQLLNSDIGNMPEDDLFSLQNKLYEIGYIWLVEQLISSKKEIKCIEIRLFHNGSNEYQSLA